MSLLRPIRLTGNGDGFCGYRFVLLLEVRGSDSEGEARALRAIRSLVSLGLGLL